VSAGRTITSQYLGSNSMHRARRPVFSAAIRWPLRGVRFSHGARIQMVAADQVIE
jgi:hypothetical protein